MKQRNKKGFSLIELVMAIAILVILTGLLAPQFMKYIDKARKAKIIQTLDTIYSVLQTSFLDTTESNNDLITSHVVIAWGKPVQGNDETLAIFEREMCKNMEAILGKKEMEKICIWIAPGFEGNTGYAMNLEMVFIRYYPSPVEGGKITDVDKHFYYYYVKGGYATEEKGNYGECHPKQQFIKWQ